MMLSEEALKCAMARAVSLGVMPQLDLVDENRDPWDVLREVVGVAIEKQRSIECGTRIKVGGKELLPEEAIPIFRDGIVELVVSLGALLEFVRLELFDGEDPDDWTDWTMVRERVRRALVLAEKEFNVKPLWHSLDVVSKRKEQGDACN